MFLRPVHVSRTVNLGVLEPLFPGKGRWEGGSPKQDEGDWPSLVNHFLKHALMTCRFELRHSISIVTGRMQQYIFTNRLHSVVSPRCASVVALLFFFVCTMLY